MVRRHIGLIGNSSKYAHRVQLLLLLICVVCGASPFYSFAQVANGALSGTVQDTAGAVVPNATVTVRNEGSGISRESVSNEVGFFKVVAVPPGTYQVTVTANGFNAWTVKGIVINQGEDRAIAKIALKPGSASETVEVNADITAVPIETSESRQVLGSTMITDLNIAGRNAAELIKVMPGMAINNGLSNSAWSSRDTRSGDGPIGKYAAAGAPPNGAVGLSMDGASITDIGSSNTQVANINQDQTAELTIVNGSFGAEYAKGPVSIQAISKSGESVFHGSGYVYARAATFNAEDSQLKVNNVAKPNDHYWYPGFTFGGPVLLPFTEFNKKRDKLFFFVGYEYMMQHPAGTLRQSVLPTDAMLNGDFSGVTAFNSQSAYVPCDPSRSADWQYASGSFCANQWAKNNVTNGKFKSFTVDPVAAAYVKMMRAMGTAPNQNPAEHNGYNYGVLDQTPINRWESRVKIDYNINQRTKLAGTYSHQHETGKYPFALYWWPGGGVKYPTSSTAVILSNTYNLSLTKVLSPTLTNDFTFAYSYYTLPLKPDNPSAMDPAQLGMNLKTPFSLADNGLLPQIPNLVSWSCNSTGQTYGCFPQLYAYSYSKGFNGGAVGNKKTVPSISENIAKTLNTHTVKAGFYWEQAKQDQSTLDTSGQGSYNFDPWSTISTENPLADFLLGNVGSFSQAAGEPMQYVRRYTYAFYVTDSWKIKRVTLNYGTRIEHNGQWLADNGKGLAIWSPATYNNNPATASATTGLLWHGIEPSVPLSGWKSKLFAFSPRVGIAYDVFGTGKTVLRGGFGLYRWQVSIGDATASYANALGIGNANLSSFSGMNQISNSSFAANSLIGSKVNVLQSGDEKTPWTENWNLIVSQALPDHSTLELQYQGNHTANSVLSNNNNSNTSLVNLNKIPVGTLLSSPECIANANYCGSKVSDQNFHSSTTPDQQQYYRPYKTYQYLTVINHGSYSNYHGFIAQWQKQRGPIKWIANYTFGKVLGTKDGNSTNGGASGNIVDAFSLSNNYGVLAYDRTHIFNIAYIVTIPNFVHNNLLARSVVNGWVFSGVTQFQSGVPLQANSNNLNVSLPVSASDVLGSPDAILMPTLTCDPRKGLKSGQYFNPSCFGVPTAGTPATATSPAVLGKNGPYEWPYLKSPSFVNTDLAVFKKFSLSERHAVELRISTFDFFNQKLKQFGVGNDLQMKITGNPGSYTFIDGFNGKPQGITGRRVAEAALKYTF